MITENGRYKCDGCGKFISQSDAEAASYVPWGNSIDTCPPEPRHECGKCVSRWDASMWLPEKNWSQPARIF